MFSIGDKVVYPMHGAGVIERIERTLISGKRSNYYIMRTCDGNMTLMIPVDNGEQSGLRNVITSDEAKEVLENFHQKCVETETNWNKRQRDNMMKIKSGDIHDSADVLKALMYREKTKGLSTSERKMLTSVKMIVTSELVLSGFADKAEVDAIIEDCIDELV